MIASDRWFWLTLFGIAGLLTYLLGPVLTPFMTAALIAYIGDPLVDWLEEKRLSRTMAVVTVFVILSTVVLLLLLVLVPLLERQVVLLISKVPSYLDWLTTTALPALLERTGFDPATVDVGQLGSMGSSLADSLQAMVKVVTSSGAALLGWIANLFLIPVVTFYLLRDWDRLVSQIHALLPQRREAVVSQLARESDAVLGSFLRGQLVVMFVLGVIYTVGLSLIGIELSLLLGMFAGVVSFVPYLGFIVGVLSAGLAALMQFQELLPLFYVVAVFTVGQVIEATVLTPTLVGDRIGLHPVAVIFAVLAGGELFGFVGILLALPVAAVAMVVLRHMHRRYISSPLYNQGGEGA